jgi:hypothetical protein
MDHLERTPLLCEAALASKQHLKPGGAAKARTRHLARTSASMPDARGEEKIIRRLDDKLRFNQPRDINKGFYSRRAQRDYSDRRKKSTHGHLALKRNNPQANHKPSKRGNPQNKGATELRVSPSKLKLRPALPRTFQFFSRSSLLKGQRL